MARDGEAEKDSEVTEINPPFDELLETYNNLLEDSLKILQKYGELKISHSKVLKAFGSTKVEKEALEEKIKSMEKEYSMSSLITEIRKLKATIDKLNYDLEQFVKGEEKLNLILGSQRSPNDKTGLGFQKAALPNLLFLLCLSLSIPLTHLYTLTLLIFSPRPTSSIKPHQTISQTTLSQKHTLPVNTMSSLSRALVKKKSFEETLSGDSQLTRVKMFDGYEAKFLFKTDLRMRNYSPPREINIDFFYKESFCCFEAFKENGWEYFLDLKEPIYPMLIRKFYANLKIDEAIMGSSLLVRGRRAVLTKGLLSELLKCPNAGICPDLDNDLITASYNKDKLIMSKQNKGNDPNSNALFIMWCLKRTLRVNLPHIIMSHMKHIRESSQELAYGMVITLIARHMKVDLKEFEGKEVSFQSRIDIGMLHQMQYRKVGKTWVKKGKDLDITPKIEDDYDLPKASKRKMMGNKGKGKRGAKLVNLEEEEASSHTEKETLVSEETVPREKSAPLSLSVETISQKTGIKAATSPPASPTLPELLKEPKNEHSIFRMLQETLRASTFNHDSLERNTTVLKQILDSIQTTNAYSHLSNPYSISKPRSPLFPRLSFL
ncbi:Retrovirus-related Pol polyprotein from transposon TNT 1-94 [Senna tora]|uniref:Retrovirus-related Pol polyprotein from transposon TNT 1-94 n=1 Tax=Senna tora TaxID=362788 RepID=A0A834TZX0_9FABA|nr:Retrovirus-related Pol polyprotein from transposon TNT 1-94 [Senna tora]